jgi:acetyltransferase-like isoleucine patch superfamily enzyme
MGRNISFYNPSRVHLGKDVYIAYGCWFMAGEHIWVGAGVLFGPYCVIVSANHTRQNRSFRFGAGRVAPIEIGNGTWIASHVTLTAGSTVGDGALVAAGSVVTGEVPSDSVVGGVPARVLKVLTDE